MSENIYVNLIIIVLSLIVIYYFLPFITGLWIGYISRRKGRRMGDILFDKLISQININLKTDKSGKLVEPPNEDEIVKLNEKIKQRVDEENSRANYNYNSKIQALNKKLEILDGKIKNFNNIKKTPEVFTKAIESGNDAIKNVFINPDYWKITFIVYGVLFLLIFDTLIFGQWLQETRLFPKDETIFEINTISNNSVETIIRNINFPKNYIVGFLINSSLLILLHILLKGINIPIKLKSIYFRITLAILSIGSIIILRFILPKSGNLARDLVLLTLWLLLLIVAHILNGYIFSKNGSAYKTIKNILFFLVLPFAIFNLLFGGLFGIVLVCLQGMVNAYHEIKKVRIEKVKDNYESRKENVEKGFYEGITKEERD